MVEGVHGWLVLDKPAGLSSAAAVAVVRRAFGGAKAGHAGTLDPLATGVLPLALGEATKLMRFAVAGRKTYEFTIRWGEQRTTDDAAGGLSAACAVRPSAAAIAAALPDFVGTIVQRPPAFSAIKVGGKRAYALARGGAAPELAPRTVVVERLTLCDCPDQNHASFELLCGTGVYVRALARDLAARLGTLGYVAALRRMQVGRFTLAQAIPLDKLADLRHSPKLADCLLPLETVLADIPALSLSDDEARRLRLGQSIAMAHAADATVCAVAGGKPVALVRVAGGVVRPERVFNL